LERLAADGYHTTVGDEQDDLPDAPIDLASISETGEQHADTGP